MIIQTRDNHQVILRKLKPDDYSRLAGYLHNLSPETKRRFGPHPFDKQSVIEFYESSDRFNGYIAIEAETQQIIAYSILKIGYLEHDSFRLQSYGITLNPSTDCTFAPSVADGWQSRGVGKSLFLHIVNEMQQIGIKRILLWGGVQSDNEKAVNFYKVHGFSILGQFEYHGTNYDMMLEIS